MLQQVINNLLQDVSLVQRYILNSQDAGFNDMTRLLEGLAIKLFNASHGLTLINKNQLAPNFPAIDLADDDRETAVQVTSNASSAKISHTLSKFKEHELDLKYNRLIIHGFVDYVKPKKLPSFCTVVGVGDIVSAVADKNDEELVQELVDALQQHTDFSRIHPYDDRNCLEIVLRCVDRNAIKHHMPVEGSYKDMVKGLNEITELISKGTIGRKSKSKSVDAFQDAEMIDYMIKTRDRIGQIIAIVNKSRVNGDFVDLQGAQRGKIDALKRQIIGLSNGIAASNGIKLSIASTGG